MRCGLPALKQRLLLAGAVMCLMTLAAPGRGAESLEPIPIRMGTLAFPSLSSVLTAILQAKGFERHYGFELQTLNYSTVSAYYAALAVGEVDTLVGGPHVLQQMRLQGVPVVATSTYARLSAMVVVARDPSIRSLPDLKGKTLAADMGSSEYQILRIVAQTEGVKFGEDVTVVQAGPALARTQLKAGRVDAAMVWEPTATLTLMDDPNYRVIFNGEEGWRRVSGLNGWELVSLTREDWIRRYPNGVQRWIQTLQHAVRYIQENPVEADGIVCRALKLPEGTFLEGWRQGRIVLEIRPAAEEEASLVEMFRAAVYSGFVRALPGPKAIYRP